MQLEAAPWVWRLDATGIRSHTGLATEAGPCWLDEHDRLFMATPLGLGIVHSMDMHLAALEVEQGRWAPGSGTHADLLARYGVMIEPQPQI